MVRLFGFVLFVATSTACYAAHPQSGVVCDPQSPLCPAGQSCLLVAGSYVCTSDAAADARVGVDAHTDVGLRIDSAPTRWTLVQTVASIALPVSIASTGAGNALIVAVETPSNSVASTVTDNAPGGGNAYTRIAASRSIVQNSSLAVEVWYATNARAGATAITATGQMLYGAAVWEVSGIASTNAVDTAAVLDNQPATTLPGGAAITTARAGDFVIAIAIVENVIAGIAPADAFTNDQSLNGNGWAHLTDHAAAAGTYQAHWEQPTSGTYCASSVAFFAAP